LETASGCARPDGLPDRRWARRSSRGRGPRPRRSWRLPRLERADEPLDPLVVGLERVLAEDGLALRVVQLQVDPVHAVVLALQVGLTDELAAKPRARGLGRHVLGALDRLVVGDALDAAALHQAVVDAAVGADVVVLEVEQ